MIRKLLSLFGIRRHDILESHLRLGGDFGALNAGTIYRLMRPSRWTTA